MIIIVICGNARMNYDKLSNQKIGKILGVTAEAIAYRKKDDYFENRPFIQAFNELESRYLKAKDTIRDISNELREKRGSQNDFSFLLFRKKYFKSHFSARDFLSCKVFYNAEKRIPNSKKVYVLELIIKEYEEFKKGIKW